MDFLLDGVLALFQAGGWKMLVMWAIGGLLCAVAAIAVGSFVKDQPS